MSSSRSLMSVQRTAVRQATEDYSQTPPYPPQPSLLLLPQGPPHNRIFHQSISLSPPDSSSSAFNLVVVLAHEQKKAMSNQRGGSSTNTKSLKQDPPLLPSFSTHVNTLLNSVVPHPSPCVAGVAAPTLLIVAPKFIL